MGVRSSDDFQNKKMKKKMTWSGSNNKSGLKLSSVTRSEIDKFWEMKKLVEEEHFLAAITAAGTFHLSPMSKHIKEYGEDKGSTLTTGPNKYNSNGFEITIGIKDWWTRSKYAYLNQPALGMWFYHLNH